MNMLKAKHTMGCVFMLTIAAQATNVMADPPAGHPIILHAAHRAEGLRDGHDLRQAIGDFHQRVSGDDPQIRRGSLAR